MSFNISGRLHDANGYYTKSMDVPANTSASTPALKTGAGGQDGQLEAAVIVAEEISLADEKIFTIALESSSASASGFVEHFRKIYTADGATTFAAGSTLVRLPIPEDAAANTRITLTTNDATAAGSILAVLEGNFHR